MEILTLLRANIRKKKGAFISIFILTAIITAVVSAITGVRINYEKGLDAAFKEADCGDTCIMIKNELLTDELRADLEENKLVGRVDYYDTVYTNGAQCGRYHDDNSYFLGEMRDGIRLFNDEKNGFAKEVPLPQKGEIYLPLGLEAKLYCGVGDKITLSFNSGVTADFTIKGFVQEPSFGAMTIGWKQCFVSAEDLEGICAEYGPSETDNAAPSITVVSVHQKEGGSLSAIKFQRELNLATGIADVANGVLNRDQTVRFSTLMPDIIINIVLVFSAFLFVIVLIVIGHSIGTDIEIDYTALGILKALGFGSAKIRRLFFWQYMLAELAGIVLGGAAAVPIERAVSGACRQVTGVLPAFGFPFARTALYLLLIICASALIIMAKTRKAARISPVRAIAGGRESVYFDSRLNAPIAKKPLSASLAFRQFTSNKKRCAGTAVIAAILTFFMITVNLIGVMMSSENAVRAMGIIICDVEVYPRAEGVGYMEDIDELVRSYSGILESGRTFSLYCSLNGENLYGEFYEDTESAFEPLRGRMPKYENEIAVTKMVAELLELEMGDEVTVSHGSERTECIITAIVQLSTDSGMSFLTNFAVAEKIGIDTSYAGKYFVLEDKSRLKELEAGIGERYGEAFAAYVNDSGQSPVEAQYGEIVELLKLVIYAFSVLFAFVVIRMACQNAFAQERAEIGIYKALGFTSRRLRLGFALRYLIVSAAGALFGTALSLLLSAKMLGRLFSVIGISRVTLEYTAQSVLVPMLAIGLCYFIFAYFSSKKVRAVEVRELVSE
ncbi:MAG: FtsX-like permease family protein [Butyrivibrio sp.]|nr:FtsX-like permease family protein [Butyrivibrio sp.]